MNTTMASIRRDSLILRMALDRKHLHAALVRNQPRPVTSLLDPETRDWLMTIGLWGLSALRLPAVVRVPLRTAASVSLRNRLVALMQAGKASH